MGRTKAAGGGMEGELGRGNDSGLSEQSGVSVVKPVLNTRTNANRDWVSRLWSRVPSPCLRTKLLYCFLPALTLFLHWKESCGHQGCINKYQHYAPKQIFKNN